MIKHAIFDLDGTILDTLKGLAASGNYTLSALGFPTHNESDYCQMIGNGMAKLVERMLPEHQRQQSTHEIALKLFNEHYDKYMMENTAPYSGIVSMLKNLQDAGIGLGVATNKSHVFAKPMIDSFFPEIFQSALGVQDGLLPKPNPDLIHRVMIDLGALASNTIYVGDSNVDIQTAHNSGIPVIGVSWGFRGAKELQEAGADYLVNTVDELESLILSLNKAE